MSQDFTLHTHTNLFDGKNSVSEMIAAAKKSGMQAIGISDHFIVHSDIPTTKAYAAATRGGYAKMYMDNFDDVLLAFQRHYDEIRQIAESETIQVLCGMEVDFFDSPDWRRGFERALKVLKPDYIIGSGHFIEYGGTVCNVHDIANAEPDESDRMLAEYWAKIQRIAQSGMFNWLAHLDLPKKCNLGQDKKWQTVEAQTIQAISDSGASIEINTKGLSLPYNEPYPSSRILRMAADANIPVLISDDAHSVDQVHRGFDVAESFARENGVKNRQSLQKILDFSNKSL